MAQSETFDWYQIIKNVIHSLGEFLIYLLTEFFFDSVGQQEETGMNAIQNKRVNNRLQYVT